MGKEFSVSPHPPEHLWVPISLLFNVDFSPFLRVKSQLRDIDHSPLLSVVPSIRMSGPRTALSWYAFVSWAMVSLSLICTINFFFLWRCGPTRVMASSLTRFLDHTQRHITSGRTPQDEWSARRRDLYLTTHNTHNRQTSMPPVVFEPTISAGGRPQTYALYGATTGTGPFFLPAGCSCILKRKMYEVVTDIGKQPELLKR